MHVIRNRNTPRVPMVAALGLALLCVGFLWVGEVSGRLAQQMPTFHSASTVPEVETVIIDRPDVDAMGAGETTITLAAAAIGNAVFDATGARIREVPFTPARVKAALNARRG